MWENLVVVLVWYQAVAAQRRAVPLLHQVLALSNKAVQAWYQAVAAQCRAVQALVAQQLITPQHNIVQMAL